MTPPLIQVRNVTKCYGKFTAVDDISFDVADGVCFGLLGPNGAGKTTTIKIMTTLLAATHGKVLIGGQDVHTHSALVRANIGYVPQAISSDGGLTGRENLTVMAQLFGLTRDQRRTRIPQVLELLELGDAADRMTRTYSGGMIRRLEVGQAILHRPKALFLDEPTVGLDPLARKSIWTHIQTLQEEFGMGIILTTHYMDEAETMCSQVAIMCRGKIAAVGSIPELKQSAGGPDTSLEEVFAFFAGRFDRETQGSLKDVQRGRHVASRLS